MPQSIHYTQENATAVITLSGRVVAEDNATLMEHLEKLIKSDAAIKAIDLTEVDYIDSYALGQVIYYCNSMAGSRATVFVVNRKGREKSFIDRLIDVSDLRQIFTIVESLEAIGPSTEGRGD
jgi:anti-anti-sigma factor